MRVVVHPIHPIEGGYQKKSLRCTRVVIKKKPMDMVDRVVMDRVVITF